MAGARRVAPLAATLVAAAVAAGCSPDATSSRAPERAVGGSSVAAPPSARSTPAPSSPSSPTAPAPAPTEPTTAPEPRVSFLTIPALGLRAFPVRRHPGAPDDAAGTAIQNDGDMASPRGAAGGVGPGEIGNYIVTGHRLSSTQPFRYLPSLPDGSRVLVRAGDAVHVYEVRRTRWTSFRSASSLAAQRAPVPGRPGVRATRPMITLSTCATIEDHAAGNYWSDEFDNPEHRIDKIGVLVATRPA